MSSTSTDSSLVAGPLKYLVHLITGGGNTGRAVHPVVGYDPDGNPLPGGNKAYALEPGGNHGKYVLTPNWQKVAATTGASRGLVISPIVGSSNYDSEWISVDAGATAPTLVSHPNGVAVLGGEDFPAGVPIGDIYCKSNSGETVLVLVGA